MMIKPPELDRILSGLDSKTVSSSDFDLNPETVLPEGRVLRDAAVLIGLIERAGELHVILTKRSSALKHHPGQIAFPGGKMDAGDDSPETCATREAFEEIGLPQTNVKPLGRLASHETVTGFRVTPVLGLITAPFTEKPETGEVAEIFSVPLAHLMHLPNFHIEGRRWRGEIRKYYTVPYGPYYIWGATARILRTLAEQAQ